jgi:hypothetical protein
MSKMNSSHVPLGFGNGYSVSSSLGPHQVVDPYNMFQMEPVTQILKSNQLQECKGMLNFRVP